MVDAFKVSYIFSLTHSHSHAHEQANTHMHTNLERRKARAVFQFCFDKERCHIRKVALTPALSLPKEGDKQCQRGEQGKPFRSNISKGI